MTSPAITLAGVGFCWPGGDRVFANLDLELDRGALLGLVGPNGCGKTTLVKLLVGLLAPTEGQVRILGRSPRDVRDRIAYVPQHASIDAQVPATVLDVVLGGRLRGSSWGFRWRRTDLDAARAALDRTDCGPLADRAFATLSGGQRQRVLIARALAAPCELLVLDEPTANVDHRATHAILDVLDTLRGELTMVLVSHDLAMLSSRATSIAWLHGSLELLDPQPGSFDRIHAEMCGRLGGPLPPPRVHAELG